MKKIGTVKEFNQYFGVVEVDNQEYFFDAGAMEVEHKLQVGSLVNVEFSATRNATYVKSIQRKNFELGGFFDNF